MVIDTANTLVDAIRGLGLFAPAQADELRRLASQVTGPRDLARHALQRGWLTAFQVNMLLRGRGHELNIGPYVLLERIGAGGMGEVFKGRHRHLQRIAAVKVLSREKLGPRGEHRFAREAEAAAQLSHPNIVAVYDAGANADRHYLAMELIDGPDLGRLVQLAGPLPVLLACDLVRQAALGLACAHAKGFVHRDIKPGNLLVAPRGGMGKASDTIDFARFDGATAKILDMGLVRLQPDRDENTEMALTQHGVVIGTLDYLAPEQARDAHRVDGRADLYGLGCTLYFLLSGEVPFPGGNALDKLLRHQTDEPPRIASLRPGVAPEVEAVVRRLMAKRPEDRCQTAADAAIALAGLLGKAVPTRVVQRPPLPVSRLTPRAGSRQLDTPVLADTIEEPQPPLIRPLPRPKPSPAARWWWVVVVLAACLLFLLVLLAMVWRKSRPAAPRAGLAPHALVRQASDR